MKFGKIKILLLAGYARQILPYLRVYKKLGCETFVLCNSKCDVGYVSRYADHRILGTIDAEDYSATEKTICQTIESGHFDVVVPMGDLEAKVLSINKTRLSQYAKIAVNDKEVFLAGLDKLTVMKACMKNDIPCPITLTEVSTISDVLNSQLIFPIVVKPRDDCGARGFHCFETTTEFEEFAKNLDLKDYVVQEYIPQSNMNMSCGLFIDKDGILKSSYVYASRRWYPIKGGTGTLNQLIQRPDIVDICKKLADLMKLQGVIGFDLIQDLRDNTAKIIEINPRVLACARIGFEAGVDQATQILQMAFDESVAESFPESRELYIRMSQIDILWFLKSPDRFRAKPSWFSFANTKDQTFYIDDPLPWFAFLLRGIGRLKKETQLRK